MDMLCQFSAKQGVETAKSSAIVIVIIEDDCQQYQFLLLCRPTKMNSYPGDWCLPGGRFEKSDQSLEQTAWRELQEETNISKQQCQMVAQLNDFYSGKGELVRPFVIAIKQQDFEQAFEENSAEVLKSRVLCLSSIRNMIEGIPPDKKSTREPAYYLSFLQKDSLQYAWGLTAGILVHLNNIIHQQDLPIDYGVRYCIKQGV
jgi:8-oxo-dGTP pyrophosphatase MutT (NUDIX family)